MQLKCIINLAHYWIKAEAMHSIEDLPFNTHWSDKCGKWKKVMERERRTNVRVGCREIKYRSSSGNKMGSKLSVTSAAVGKNAPRERLSRASFNFIFIVRLWHGSASLNFVPFSQRGRRHLQQSGWYMASKIPKENFSPFVSTGAMGLRK